MLGNESQKSWFAELNVDMDKVSKEQKKSSIHKQVFILFLKMKSFLQIQEIVRAIINLYEMWKSYDEKKEIQGLLAKMPKPKPAPQR